MEQSTYKSKLVKIKAFAFDVDGVLSSGVLCMPDGDLLRLMDIRDGFVIRKALINNYKVAIITKGSSPSVILRFKKLGIEDIYSGKDRKLDSLNDFAKKYSLSLDEILYQGDDLPDLHCVEAAGLGTCPKNATREIIEAADYVSPYEGGHGSVRDVVEQVLRAKNDWKIDEDV